MQEIYWKSVIGLLVAVAIVIGASCAQSLGGVKMGKTASAEDPVPPNAETALFAGGCFWCMEPPFEKLEGVMRVTSGYTGGEEKDPSYDDVSYGRTGHLEAVQVLYDPEKIGYEKLLEVYWRQIDPTDDGGQFADRGAQYRTAIFVADEDQRAAAEASKAALERTGPFDEPIVTPILDAGAFWPAEDYHQDYYKKNPRHYEMYRRGSGREGFLERVWRSKGP